MSPARNTSKVSVLLPPREAARFEEYCKQRGYKKSTLIVRLIREHLDSERFPAQAALFDENASSRDKRMKKLVF